MNLSISPIRSSYINAVKNSQPVFSGKMEGVQDSLKLSPEAKEKTEIIQNLKNYGINDEDATEFTRKYYGTQSFIDLIEGEYDDDINYPTHCIGTLDRNLTKEEAIVYLGYEMDKYYGKSVENMENFKIMPLDFAKEIQETGDTTIAGSVLKGEISEEDAIKVKPYYLACIEHFYDSENESVLHKLTSHIESLQVLTSDKKDEDGNLESGLIRPLTEEEAGLALYFDGADTDYMNLLLMIEEGGGQEFNDGIIDGPDETIEYLVSKLKYLTPELIESFIYEYDFDLSRIMQHIEFLEQFDAQQNSGFVLKRELTSDELKTAIQYKLTPIQTNKFIEYINEGIDIDEAGFEASFSALS